MSLANLPEFAHFECAVDTPTGLALMALVQGNGPHRLNGAGSCHGCKVPCIIGNDVQPTWIACPVRVAIENQKLLPEHSAHQLTEHIRNMHVEYEAEKLPTLGSGANNDHYAQHSILASLHFAITMISKQLEHVQDQTDLHKKQEATLVLKDIVAKSKLSVESTHHMLTIAASKRSANSRGWDYVKALRQQAGLTRSQEQVELLREQARTSISKNLLERLTSAVDYRFYQLPSEAQEKAKNAVDKLLKDRNANKRRFNNNNNSGSSKKPRKKSK